MYDTGIVELRKIAENRWKAKYQGNYGVYTIKITTNGKKTVGFSCSCPSDYSPCKHISIPNYTMQFCSNFQRMQGLPKAINTQASYRKLLRLSLMMKMIIILRNVSILTFWTNGLTKHGTVCA